MESNLQAIILILLAPFAGALAYGLLPLRAPRLNIFFGVISLLAGIGCALLIFLQLASGEVLKYAIGGWNSPLGIEFQVDRFNVLLVVFIYLISLLNLLHSQQVLTSLYPRSWHFHTLYLLLTTAFAGMLLTADIFNMYVFLEITSLTSYALIGRGDGRACRAAFNYLLVGTVGASFYLIGIGFLYLKTGMLSIEPLKEILAIHPDSEVVRVGFVFMLLGLMIKMAVFPLHIWLPNAYTYAPQPSAGLLAPLSTKVALFLMFKIVLSLFSLSYLEQYFHLQNFLVNLTAIGIIIVSLMALSQKNRVKSFTYIIIAEIGYIFGGFWLLNKHGMTGSAYHLFCDMLLTAGIFLFIGTIRIYFKHFTDHNLKGFFQTFPFAGICFLVTGLCMIGVPPTGGFVSKFYLLSGAIAQNQWLFVFSLLFASLTAAIIVFRIIELAFFNTETPIYVHLKQSSKTLVNFSLGTIAAGLILLGIFQQQLVDNIILPFLGL